MASISDLQEVAGVFLNWSSLLLVLFIVGIGYIGLVFIQNLRGKRIYDMPLFDKIIRSSLLGFISFSSLLSFIGVDLTSQEAILKLIGKTGITLFLITSFICIGISNLVYVIFYILPNVEISVKNKSKRRKTNKP